MKAYARTKYGLPDVLTPREMEMPVPDDDQVLLSVRAASINKSDWYELTGPLLIRLVGGGVRKPKMQLLLGDVAGRVESVGKNVTRFHQGDEVFGVARWGLAEFTCARQDRLTLKPQNVSFEEAAAVPIAAITALQGLRDKGKVYQGQRVLIDGASGGVGSYAVQIAKSYGAEVTAVCSTQNQDLARGLGADYIIDYTKEDFTKNGKKYDLVLGVNGVHSVFSYKRSLADNGAYVMVGASKVFSQLIQTALLGRLLSRGGKRMGFMGIARLNQNDLDTLRDLLQAGKIKSFVDRAYAFDQTVEAFRYFGEGHVHGKVVITVGLGA